MTTCFSGLGETLFQTSLNIVLVVAQDASILAVNPSALTALGYAENDLINQNISLVLNISDQQPDKIPDLKNVTNQDILKYLISRTNQDEFLNIRHKSGRIFASRINVGDKTKCPDGVPHYVVCIADNGELHRTISEHDEQTKLMHSAFDAIPEGFAVYGADDRLQVFNETYANIFKNEKNVKLGITFEDILRYGLDRKQYDGVGESQKEQEQWLKQQLHEHKNPNGPLNRVLKDGRIIRVDERKLDDGRTVSVRTDITQLVQSKSVAESLGEVLDNIAAPVIFTNIETNKLEYANKALLKKLQYTSEEFLNLSSKDITRGIEPHKIRAFIQRVFHNPGTVQQVRITHVRKDGTTYPCIVNSICEVGDNPKRIISFIEDESIEMQIREELMMRTAEQETLIHNLPGFMTHAKPDTTIVFANELYANALGETAEALEGRKFQEFIPDEDLSIVLEGIAQLTPDEPTLTFEQRLKVIDGSIRDVLWTNRMIFKNGAAAELISVGRDITSSKNAYRKIEDQAHALSLRNQALEQFAGIVSHDLRSPLRHIRMFGEMLVEDQSKGQVAELPKYIAKIRDNIIRMEGIIASLLEFSQMAYKQVNRSRFLLSAALDEAKDNLSNVILDKHAIIELNNDTDLHLDYILIVRLLQNLLDNAIKYTDDKTTPMMTVDTEYIEDQHIISVADNGIGIDPEQAIRIFNVFQRLHVDERAFKGTGIGLALAKRIVEGHSGQIKLDTDYRGGAKFVMSFPVFKNG